MSIEWKWRREWKEESSFPWPQKSAREFRLIDWPRLAFALRAFVPVSLGLARARASGPPLALTQQRRQQQQQQQHRKHWHWHQHQPSRRLRRPPHKPFATSERRIRPPRGANLIQCLRAEQANFECASSGEAKIGHAVGLANLCAVATFCAAMATRPAGRPDCLCGRSSGGHFLTLVSGQTAAEGAIGAAPVWPN